MRHRRCARRGFALLALCSLPFPAGGQQPGPQRPPEPPKNLQVLPKDISHDDLIGTMQGFTQALGVRCPYCHADEVPGQDTDMSSDEKVTKTTARAMLRLAGDINGKLATAVAKPAGELTRVQCITCHRGVAIPKQLTEILTSTTVDKGLAAAIAQYRELRKQYYGAQAYDFSESGLIPFAQRQIQANKPDDAVAWLQLNLEFYPNSVRSYLTMAQAFERKNDKDAAIKNVQQALAIDPQNAAAKRALEQLRK